MSEQSSERGAAEENAGVPDTPAEHDEPASPSSTPGGTPAETDGYAEEAADVEQE